MSVSRITVVQTAWIAELDGADLKIALAVQAFANIEDEGWVRAYPKTIAEIAGVDRTTVTRRLNRMVEDGKVEKRERKVHRSGRKSYEYRILLDAHPKCAGTHFESADLHVESAAGALPEELDSRTNKNLEGEAPRARTSKPLRWNSDWELPVEWMEFALSEGMTSTEVHREFASFGDYWINRTDARGAKVSWTATWRNRVRDVIANRRPAQARSRGGGDRERPARGSAVLDGLRAECDAAERGRANGHDTVELRPDASGAHRF